MADDSQQLGQNEIEQLLKQASGGAAPTPSADQPDPGGGPALGQQEIEALLSGGTAKSAAAPATAKPPAEPGRPMSQSDIESLVKTPPKQPAPATRAPTGGGDDQLARGDVEFLLNQAQEALASIQSPYQPETQAAASPFKLHEFTGAAPNAERATLDLIRDVDLDLKIELGRTQMYLEDVLKLRRGSVVPLDKLAGDPVDIYVNGRLIARGEVLVLNDNFCVRVAELISTETAKAG